MIVLGGIGINQRVGPVIFQNLVPGRGNSVTEQRYIEQMLIHSNRPILCRGDTIKQQDNTHSPSASDTHHNIRTTPGPSPNPIPLSIYLMTFKPGSTRCVPDQPRPQISAGRTSMLGPTSIGQLLTAWSTLYRSYAGLSSMLMEVTHNTECTKVGDAS